MILLVSFVFLFYVCASNGVTVKTSLKENYWDGFLRNDYNNYQDKDHYHDSITRPCSIKHQDEDCIRRVFTSTFNCLPTHGPVPDPYLADTLDMEIPHSNLTFTINDAKIKGLSSGKIKEFYFNTETHRFVLEVVFDSVVVFSPRSIVTHYRKGMEPIESTDFSIIEFKSLSLTLVISSVRKEVWKAHVYAYITDADIPYKFGPGLIESKDRQIRNNPKKIMDNMVLSVKEAFLTQGPLFMSVYLQSNIYERHPVLTGFLLLLYSSVLSVALVGRITYIYIYII